MSPYNKASVYNLRRKGEKTVCEVEMFATNSQLHFIFIDRFTLLSTGDARERRQEKARLARREAARSKVKPSMFACSAVLMCLIVEFVPPFYGRDLETEYRVAAARYLRVSG